MRRFAILLLSLSVCVGLVSAQKKLKPWTEWSDKDAQKVLEESPWANTQTETDTSEMFFSPTTQGNSGPGTSRGQQGATNQATKVNFHIRLLSAKPIRQALARDERQTTGNADGLEGIRRPRL